MREAPKVVVVTGASAGIGRAVARRFAQDGAWIGLIARGSDRLTATAMEVEQLGGRAFVCPCDVADNDALDAAASDIEEKFGPIDIWINVAFAGVLMRFEDIEPADFERVTDVTYHGQVNGARAALKRMLLRNRGSIVLTGSALAYRGIPLQSAYCGAKHALQGFQDSLRSELFAAKSQVHVSMVQLPGVNTPQFDWIKTNLPSKPKPASPPFQPEVAADAIHYAAHHRLKQILVGGPTVMAVIGDIVASPLLDRYLAWTGLKGQQDSMPVEPDRPNNLWDPPAGDPGAHGRFDAIARSFSLQLQLAKRPYWTTAVSLSLACAATIVLARRSRRSAKPVQ